MTATAAILITYKPIHNGHHDVADNYAYTTTRHRQHTPDGHL